MLYSSAGFLALVILIIINYDVLRRDPKRSSIPAHRAYRAYLISVSVYYVTDILWGVLYQLEPRGWVFADTALYFTAMGCSILLWTRYVIEYLQEKRLFGRLLGIIGWLFFGYEMAVLAANFFLPVLFSFDAQGVYHAEAGRYITLGIQIVMFLMTAVYALTAAFAHQGTMRLRHRTIALFSASMAGFVTAQAYYPLLPLYAIGCMLGSCVLHSFVLENEKDEYRDALEERLRENLTKGNYYDLLTGLPGMTYFFELAGKKRSATDKGNGRTAFLYLNISGMKFYNRRHGFAGGDRLLQALAQKLISTFGSENCSRMGQDHFAVITESEGLEDRLHRLFRDWEAQNAGDCPAILVGIYPDSMDNIDVSTACDLAKIACDAMGSTYVSSLRYFDATMYVTAERQQYIIAHLDQALAEQWIQVYYQPIVRAASGRVCDEEALARWIDPVRGTLPPSEFISILEDSKLIYKLDLYVLDQILGKLRRQRDAGLYLVPQSINLSRADFDVCDMVEEIRRRVDEAGLPHSLLTIEITESVIGSSFDFIKAQSERFQSLGFSVWMDDFGSGYSSLDVLQSMQVDLIKFDMRFMQQFNRDQKSRIILTELVKMAVGLGIDTVCEGVEREDQVEFLREIGCTKLQGYYYTRPLPMDEILRRYENGTQIGFENPEESDYFDAIGRINLYDLDGIAKEDEDSLQHYFSTVPMAIIEIRGDTHRFARSNPAYRDFMERSFRLDLTRLNGDFEAAPQGFSTSFITSLHQCCREGGRALFDEALPDGSTLHAFMRRIAENPLNGTVAVAVAILAVLDPHST